MTSSTKIAEKEPREATQVNYSQDDAKQGGFEQGYVGQKFLLRFNSWLDILYIKSTSNNFILLENCKVNIKMWEGKFFELGNPNTKIPRGGDGPCMLALSHLLFRTANASSSIWNWLTLHFLAAKHEMWGGEILENHVKMCWAAMLKQWQRLIL